MRICAQCRSAVGADWRFCRYCGAPLEIASAPASPTAREMEEEPETQLLESRETAPAYLPPEPGPEAHPPPRRRFRLLALVLIGALALGTLSSAGLFFWHEVARYWNPARLPARQGAEFSRRLALPFGSEVTLVNTNGNVTVTTWAEEEAAIVARKRGGADRDLADVRIEVTRERNALSIQTLHPEGSDAAVDYELTLPRRVNLSNMRIVNGRVHIRDIEGVVRVQVVNGRIEAEGIAGAVQAETVNGRIEVAFTQCASDRDTTLRSVNGRISVTLPETCDARLEAETLHGEIEADDALGLTFSEGRFTGRRAEGRLGHGEAMIRLSALNGTIRIRRSPE